MNLIVILFLLVIPTLLTYVAVRLAFEIIDNYRKYNNTNDIDQALDKGLEDASVA